MKISSRTDAGVHALNTTVHVDLERKDKQPYNPNYITTYLNNTFFKYGIPIRINHTYIIPSDLPFHCRYSAIKRKYLYRFAVIKPEKALDPSGYTPHFIPIEETDRSFFIQSPTFDFEAVQEVLPYFIGKRDFRSFMGLNSTVRSEHCMFTVRKIEKAVLNRGESSSSVFNREKANSTYNYYDFIISGKSFIYRQVRRIVATLIALGQGKITKKDVYEMITIPGAHNWDNRIKVVPACGLYLCNVVYDKSEFEQIRAYNESFELTTGRQKHIETN